jgi:hypothetical protein
MSVLHWKHITSPLQAQQVMRSTGLWRCYINITITILDIIHHPVLYLRPPMDNIRTSPKTHYVSATEPNRLMQSIGIWRWNINITVTILDIIHRSVFYLKDYVSETGFRLRLKAELTQLGPTSTR